MEPLRELLTRTLQGNPEAFGEVVSRTQGMAFACAYSILRDRQDAEDAVQDAFITAYSRLGDLRDLERFPGWLRRIVVSACTRITRRPRLPAAPMDAAERSPAADGDPAVHVERAEIRAEVRQALAVLPPAYRMATTLFYIDGYSVQDVAEFLEVPAGTVKYRLHEARRRLKERMVEQMRDDLSAARPGSELRQGIIDTLMARRERFDEAIVAYYAGEAVPAAEHEWAARWHERRLQDVRANAAQYGMAPDESLPRMLPEYRRENTYRDDFTDIPRRWGVPEGTQVVCLRDLARRLAVKPVAIHRWERDGLPVLRYSPWQAYDEARAEAWARARGTRPDERMAAEEAREPLLFLLRAVAAGEVPEAEARPTYDALEALAWQPDRLWDADWTALRPSEREANALLYGLSTPAPTPEGTPQSAATYEVRDITRRLGLSPFEIIRWTRDGMPAIRRSPYIRWDPVQVARWMADRGVLPAREYTPRELDDLPLFVIGAVARGEEPPEDARDIFASWVGVM